MLRPDERTLYTDALRPPPGFRFRDAIATTYSLDLETLLTIPLHLALFSAEGDTDELLQDGVALLEALRRTTHGVTVYTQSSRILTPSQPNPLFGLLEPCVIEVTSPSPGGVFHPKIWLLRFGQPTTGAERYRLLVLSRNLTGDRSWDLSLTLEGVDTGEPRPENEPLARFLDALPTLAVRPPGTGRVEHVQALSRAVRGVRWEPPEPFESLSFHAIGLRTGEGWLPEHSSRLGVVSPFVSDAALTDLAGTTHEAIVLFSRPEELQQIGADVLESFGRVMTLAEQAEREDGEEVLHTRDSLHPSHGLHAKAYAAERGWRTHLYVGSANATNAALLNGINVEFLCELVGLRSRVGGVDDLLNPEGLGSILEDYRPMDAAEPDDPAVKEAEERLERARRSLAASGLRLLFAQTVESDWTVTLTADHAPDLSGIDTLRAWLVTRQSTPGAEALGLAMKEAVRLREASIAHLTTFVGFEMSTSGAEESATFVLSAAADGLPAQDRDAAIVRDVIRNRDGFLRYVMLFLAEAGLDGGAFGVGGSMWSRSRGVVVDNEVLPIFESMTRVYCEDPKRLESIDRLLREMGVASDSRESDVVPPEFVSLWSVFRDALADTEGRGR